MSKTFIRISIIKVPESYMWVQLKKVIHDALANTVDHQEYEFYNYGDAMLLQSTCDDLDIEYSLSDVSED